MILNIDLANPKCDPEKLLKTFKKYCNYLGRRGFWLYAQIPGTINNSHRLRFHERIIWKWLWWHLKHNGFPSRRDPPYHNMSPEIKNLTNMLIHTWEKLDLIYYVPDDGNWYYFTEKT